MGKRARMRLSNPRRLSQSRGLAKDKHLLGLLLALLDGRNVGSRFETLAKPVPNPYIYWRPYIYSCWRSELPQFAAPVSGGGRQL